MKNKNKNKNIISIVIAISMLFIGCSSTSTGPNPEDEHSDTFKGTTLQVSDGLYEGYYWEEGSYEGGGCDKAVKLLFDVRGHDLHYYSISRYYCQPRNENTLLVLDGDTLYNASYNTSTQATTDTIRVSSEGTIEIKDGHHLCITVPVLTECFYLAYIEPFYFEILIGKKVSTFVKL